MTGVGTISVLGAGLVMTAAVWAAGCLAGALNMRQKELASWVLAVRLLGREIAWGAEPLPRLCARIGGQVGGVAGEFLAEAAENGQNKVLMLDMLQKKAEGWHLLAGDEMVLAELLAGLGQTDLAGQKKLLGQMEARLGALQEESVGRYARLARLIKGLGWCGGLLMVTLVI